MTLPNFARFYRPTWLAKELGIPRSTVISAVERGEILTYTTGCGVELTTREEVEAWAVRGPDNLGIGKPRRWDATTTTTTPEPKEPSNG
jgi:hypothetical protein